MTGALELDRETDTAKTPDRVWKCRYVFKRRFLSVCEICGVTDLVSVGDEWVPCCEAWPTKEEADKSAEKNAEAAIAVGAVYLGAVPVEAA